MKRKVYIETTIPSYLTARPSRDITLLYHQEITKTWWEKYKNDYDLYISEIVYEEAAKGDKQYAALRIAMLRNIPELKNNAEVEALAEKYLNHFCFPSESIRDAYHIAFAVYYKMDFLLTWNCTHLDNEQIKRALHRLNSKFGYNTPGICTPLTLVPPELKPGKEEEL